MRDLTVLRKYDLPLTISLFFILFFFFVIEWRWQALLLGTFDFKSHIVTAVLACFILFTYFSKIKKHILIFWALFFIIIYFIIIALFNIKDLYKLPNYQITTELGIWCINLGLFLVAANDRVWNFVFCHTRVVFVLYLLLIVPIWFILIQSGHMVTSGFNLRIAVSLAKMANDSKFGVAYQSIGDKLALITFIVISLNIKKKVKCAILFLTTITLFVIGTKASLVGFSFACIVYHLISIFVKHNSKQLFVCFIFMCLLFIIGVYFVENRDSLSYSNNWLVHSVALGKNDVSFSSRNYIEELNQPTRISRFLLGNYKFDYKLLRSGSYTHNSIGIIDYYGLPIFIYVTGCWLYLLLSLLCMIKKRNAFVKIATMTMLFYTLLFSVARFPTANYLFYWTLGTAVMAMSQNKISRS